MPRKVFQPSQHKEEAMELLRGGKGAKEVAETTGISERTAFRYVEELRKDPAGKVTEERVLSSQKVVKEPTELAVVTTKVPGPIVFRMGGQEIDLNPNDLYDAWRYCEDIKRIEPSIDDSFTVMLKVATKSLWEFFSQREAHRNGAIVEIVKEVTQ